MRVWENSVLCAVTLLRRPPSAPLSCVFMSACTVYLMETEGPSERRFVCCIITSLAPFSLSNHSRMAMHSPADVRQALQTRRQVFILKTVVKVSLCLSLLPRSLSLPVSCDPSLSTFNPEDMQMHLLWLKLF